RFVGPGGGDRGGWQHPGVARGVRFQGGEDLPDIELGAGGVHRRRDVDWNRDVDPGHGCLRSQERLAKERATIRTRATRSPAASSTSSAPAVDTPVHTPAPATAASWAAPARRNPSVKAART